MLFLISLQPFGPVFKEKLVFVAVPLKIILYSNVNMCYRSPFDHPFNEQQKSYDFTEDLSSQYAKFSQLLKLLEIWKDQAVKLPVTPYIMPSVWRM